MSPKVSIIVLNYNGLDFLKECLNSIESQTYRDFELLVVDNASADGSWEIARDWCAAHGHAAIRNEQNLGYSEGNNVGIRQAKGDWVLVLNNDTVVEASWLSELMSAVEVYPDCDMFASQIRSYDQPEVLDTVGIIVYRDGMSRGLGRLEPVERYQEPREVFAPSGCAGLYRRSVLVKVGMFPADFFAYCEDMDLGMRIRLAGGRCWYVPTAIVYHHYSASSGKYSAFKAYLVERNHLYLRMRLFPWRMILASPFYSFFRYGLQAYSVLAGRGAAGEYAKTAPATGLIAILLKAYGHFVCHLPRLMRQRREIRRFRKVKSAEVSAWFDRFAITAQELALKK